MAELSALAGELERKRAELANVNDKLKGIMGRDPNRRPKRQRDSMDRRLGPRGEGVNKRRGVARQAGVEEEEEEADSDDDEGGHRIRSSVVVVESRLGPRDGDRRRQEDGRMPPRRGGGGDRPFRRDRDMGRERERDAGMGRRGSRDRERERDRGRDREREAPQPAPQPLVIKTERPPRQPRSADNSEQGRKRASRLFGFLNNTLKSAAATASAKSKSQEKLKEIEAKLEEQSRAEKEKAYEQRQALFDARKAAREDMWRLEHDMAVMECGAEWDAQRKRLSRFIRTKTDPPIFFLPVKHTEETTKLLEESIKIVLVAPVLDAKAPGAPEGEEGEEGEANGHSKGEGEGKETTAAPPANGDESTPNAEVGTEPPPTEADPAPTAE